MSLAILSARFDQKSGMSAMTAMVDGCAACACLVVDNLDGWIEWLGSAMLSEICRKGYDT